MERHCNLRSTAHQSGTPKTTLHPQLGEKVINRVNVYVNSILTQKNKLDLTEWMLSHIQPDGLFDDMYQHIHIDKKWFFLMKQKQKYYLLPDEKPPVPTAKSKLLIQKVTFLCAAG